MFFQIIRQMKHGQGIMKGKMDTVHLCLDLIAYGYVWYYNCIRKNFAKEDTKNESV